MLVRIFALLKLARKVFALPVVQGEACVGDQFDHSVFECIVSLFHLAE